MAQTIARDSPVPYYEQLFSILRDRIIGGEITSDERLPSELELCRDFGLSRATVRQTLSKLESEGFARRVPHRGFFASTPEEQSGWTLQEGFLESQLRHGRTGTATAVISAGLVRAPIHVAESLQVDVGTDVFALERVRSLEGTAAMYSSNWFPPEVGRAVAASTGVLDGSESLNAVLRQSGYVANSAQRVLHAKRPTAVIAEHLGIDEDEPMLRVRSLTWDRAGLRFDYYETWVLTDVIPLEVNIAAS